MAETINYDTYVEDSLKMAAEARDQVDEEEFSASVEPEPKESVGSALLGWGKRLPRNISASTFKFILNSAESLDDVFQAGAEAITVQPGEEQAGPGSRKAVEGEDTTIEPVKPLQTLFPDVFENAHEIANAMDQKNVFPQTGSTAANIALSDDVFQSIAQFAVPFTFYLKAFGGLKNVSTAAKLKNIVLAEGVTAATAFEAHEARVADLVEMGRQLENKFGETLNAVFPDGSLQNEFIDYMINREDESALEGRWKNAVDSVVTTAALAGFLKASAVAIKQTWRGVGKLADIPMKRFREAEVPETPAAPERAESQRLEFNEDDALVEEFGEGTIRIASETPEGVAQVGLKRRGDVLQVVTTDVDSRLRGQGVGQQLIEQAYNRAQREGLPLVSDSSVSVGQLRAYDALRRKGWTIEYDNPDEVAKAIAERPPTFSVVADGLRPVVKKIEPPAGAS